MDGPEREPSPLVGLEGIPRDIVETALDAFLLVELEGTVEAIARAIHAERKSAHAERERIANMCAGVGRFLLSKHRDSSFGELIGAIAKAIRPQEEK